MKVPTSFLAILLAVLCGAQAGNNSIPATMNPTIQRALATAGDNAPKLRAFLETLPAEQRKAGEFLITHMPETDLRDINPAILQDNVKYAFKAREAHPWAAGVPEEIFLNDVLPYAVVDETRENWRPAMYELFRGKVSGCETLEEAVIAVNREINTVTGVEYNTLREKTNQSPSESMRQHMASCTGLAVLLVDAFRSVGIPARFAGTASWHDDRGNHSWVEVWVDGQWKITEFYMPRTLNKPWFMANAAKADPGVRRYAIYATSYKPTGDYFPMVWSKASRQVHAVNVSQRYIGAYRELLEKVEREGTHVFVKLRMFKDRQHTAHSGDRVAVNVDVFEGRMQVDGGRTAGPRQDMNDILTFLLEKNKTYTFMYQKADGSREEVQARVGDKPATFDAFMN